MIRLSDLISVIIPVYNVERYLDRCMKSVLNQTYQNLEIILVDDKSTDQSGAICRRYISDSRVIFLAHEENMGLSAARNSGLRVAHGQYAVFIDSDDYIENTMIENLYVCLNETDADTVIGGYKKIVGRRTETIKNKFAGMVFHTSEDIKKVLTKMLGSDGIDHIEMSVWKVLFSLNIIRENHLSFPDRKYLCEDIIFDFDYYPLAKRVAMCDDTGYCYCLNEMSLSQMYQRNKEQRIKIQTAEMTSRALAMHLDENAFIRIDNFYIGNLIHHIKTIAANEAKIGKTESLRSCRVICNLENVRKVKWNTIKQCFQGKDRISFILFKNNQPILLYGYMRFLTKMRSIIRKL